MGGLRHRSGWHHFSIDKTWLRDAFFPYYSWEDIIIPGWSLRQLKNEGTGLDSLDYPHKGGKLFDHNGELNGKTVYL